MITEAIRAQQGLSESEEPEYLELIALMKNGGRAADILKLLSGLEEGEVYVLEVLNHELNCRAVLKGGAPLYMKCEEVEGEIELQELPALLSGKTEIRLYRVATALPSLRGVRPLGLEPIDYRHSLIYEYYEKLLHEILALSEESAGTLEKLGVLLASRFFIEEALMGMTGYPRKEEHYAQHLNILGLLDSVTNALKSGEFNRAIHKLIELGYIYAHHVEYYDVKLIQYLRSLL